MSIAVDYEFPESVPGFQQFTWFACDKEGRWHAFFSEPGQTDDGWANLFPLMGYSHEIVGGHTASDLLDDLGRRFDWKASKFQTCKDG